MKSENKQHSEKDAILSDRAPSAAAVTSGLFTPAFWRSFVALSLILATMSFMNVSVFPNFDGIFAPARDLSVTANAMVLIVVGLMATFRPEHLRVDVLNIGGLVVLLVGCLLPLSLGLGSMPLVVLSACVLQQFQYNDSGF